MSLKFWWFSLLLFQATATFAQVNTIPKSNILNIGLEAPPLFVSDWIKGPPIDSFKKGHVYVIEFWATWCKPCIAAMPYLSKLAVKFKEKVTIIGINAYEKKTTSKGKVLAFVDSMGKKMNYEVAIEDSNFMSMAWMKASGEQGIPKTFVVNGDGQLAWIGHPTELEAVLVRIAEGKWEIKNALENRNLEIRLEELDLAANYKLRNYAGNIHGQDFYGDPDSSLYFINEIVKMEPLMKFAPNLARYTFSALLITNQQAAIKYGTKALENSTAKNPFNYDAIISGITKFSDIYSFPPHLYQLGVDCYIAKIKQYPKAMNIPKNYMKMAEWCWRANDKSNAIRFQRKATKAMKRTKNSSNLFW